MNKATQLYQQMARTYQHIPVTFFKEVLRVEPSQQQIKMILSGHLPGARTAVKSATGTGKTFTAAGLILHQILCEPDLKILATAPTAGQLKRGLKSEVTKLHRRMPQALQDIVVLKADELHLSNKAEQFCSFVSANTENKESLAGLHAGKVLIINDEASAVSDDAHDTLVGNLTTDGSSMIQISNPVRADGRFRSLWSNPELGKIWDLFTLDAYGSPFVGDKWIEEQLASYGADSDFFRMRVLGEFPRISEDLFFDYDMSLAAMDRHLQSHQYQHFPKICGVDVARFGSDLTVFLLRQGPMVLDVKTFKGLSTDQVASELLAYHALHNAESYCIDGIGVGAGVVDQARVLGLPVAEVISNERSSNPKMYYNVRSQLYGAAKEWFNNGGCMPKDQAFLDQLSSIRYGYNLKLQLQLISKTDLKRRYKVDSPDLVDALTYSFYEVYRQFQSPASSVVQPRVIVPASFHY